MQKTLQIGATSSDYRYWMLFVDIDGSAMIFRDGTAIAKLSPSAVQEICENAKPLDRVERLVAALATTSKRNIEARVAEKFLGGAEWLAKRF